ncbi:MAG TPA: LysM peptidoglycan-binding domain-containing protein [Clostridia bacterium]|nr:LysM peptidoglycan-binding domain-containing protein [Clostridia bacterium]
MRYIVQPGDTLYSIARKHNTTVDAIVAANPGINPNLIFPGQIVMIPSSTNPPQGTEYVVQPGDTLYGIAARHNVDLQELIHVNGIQPPYIIHPGQKIIIPGVPTPPGENQVYVVKPGDTLYSIAKKFNVSLEEMIRINNLSNPDQISPGQKLLIPKRA